MLSNVRIETKTPYTKAWIDDKEIQGVQELWFHAAVDEVPTLTLSLAVNEAKYDGEVLVDGDA